MSECKAWLLHTVHFSIPWFTVRDLESKSNKRKESNYDSINKIRTLLGGAQMWVASVCTSKRFVGKPGMVAHAFNPSTGEAEAGGFLSSRPAWSTKWVPAGQPGLYRETLSRKSHKRKKKKICGPTRSEDPKTGQTFGILSWTIYVCPGVKEF